MQMFPRSPWIATTLTLASMMASTGCDPALRCGALGAVEIGGRCVEPDGGEASDGPEQDGGTEGGNSSTAGDAASTEDDAPDRDGDGVPDARDNCAEVSNADQEDADGDAVGDACDDDDDGDTVGDEEDNCPDEPNADQADRDGDGHGDACDPDIDGDGLTNETDGCPEGVRSGPDADEDGCKDAEDDNVDGDGLPNDTDACPEDAEEADAVDRDGCPLALDACGYGLGGGPDTDGDGCQDEEDLDPNTPAVPAHRIHVDAANASETQDGSSWATAFTHLQDGLAAAAAVEEPAGGVIEVWVAAGTYRPDQGEGHTEGSREESFVLPNVVRLIGGFRYDDAAGRWRRDALTETVLSGDLAGDDLPDEPDTALALVGHNACHVVRIPDETATDRVVVDGFSVVGGNASADTCDVRHGGGILVEGPTQLVNLHVTRNRAEDGGAVHAGKAGGRFEVVRCTFERNRAERGGALLTKGQTTIYGSLFAANEATDEGGAIHGTELEIQNSVLRGNASESERAPSGAVYAGSSAVFVHSTLVGNGPGGAFGGTSVDESTFTFTASIVEDTGLEAFTCDQSIVDGMDCDGEPLPVTFVSRPSPQVAPTTEGDLHITGTPPEISSPLARCQLEAPTLGPLCETAQQFLYDHDGSPRWQGEAPDMGAYESSP